MVYSKIAIILALLVAGACTTSMNWQFSFRLGATDLECYTWAVFSVALDILKWLMPSCAAACWPARRVRASAATLIWIVATIYSFIAAIGFAAFNRDAVVAQRAQQIALQEKLATMKLSPRWQSSAACADATSVQSKQFCATYRETEVQLSKGFASADPQAELLAKLTGLPLGTIPMALAIFLAATSEIVSALGFFAALAPRDARADASQRSQWQPPAWKAPSRPDISRPAATRRDAARQDETRK